MELQTFIIIGLLGTVAFLLFFKPKQQNSDLTKTVEDMKALMESKFFQQTNTLDTRLEASTRNLLEVTRVLSEVKESNKRIHDVGKDIASLSSILSSPKLRGNLGEFLLEEVLANFLPKDLYRLQETFPGGVIADACIHLVDEKKLCIDAKFPLTNFQKVAAEEDPAVKDQYYKLFIRDVKKHIDAISFKYILPEHGTLDMALMYIPAENVYYDIIASGKEPELLDYAFEKKVIPVSPASLFSYIQIIVMGFKGMQVEKEAGQIVKNLSQLSRVLRVFEEEYDKMGKHLSNASKSFDSSQKTLEKIVWTVKTVHGHKESLDSVDMLEANTTEEMEKKIYITQK